MKVAVLTLVALAAPCLAGCASFGLGGEAAPGKPSGAATASTAPVPGASTPNPQPIAPVGSVQAQPLPPGPPASAATTPPPSAAAPATPSGAALGGVLGGPIGASLTEADRRAAWNAQIAALDSGQSRSWRGAQGVFVFVAPGAETGGSCRAYSQTIYVGGRPNRGGGVACKQPDGTWKMTG
jgi:surface antigen